MKKKRTIKAIKILVVAALIFTSGIIGLYIGSASDSKENKAPTMTENSTYEYIEAESGAYWCELYEDGRATIHTMQKFITNDKDGNLIVKGDQGNED